MGFSVGDIFSKNFLSADTIIGGKSKQESFAAEIVGVSGVTSGQATFFQALTFSMPGSSTGITAEFRKKGSGSTYNGAGGQTPSFVQWENDRIKLLGASDYGVTVKGAGAGNEMTFRIESNAKMGGTGHLGPVATYNGNKLSLLGAAQTAAFTNIKEVPGSGGKKVDVTLTSGNHYISLDPGADASGIGTFTVKFKGPNGDIKFERNNSYDARISGSGKATPMYLGLVKWVQYKDGCMDNEAYNYKTTYNRQPASVTCTYRVAPVDTFTISKSQVTQGAADSVTFDWSLDTSKRQNASSVKLLVSNSSGNDQEITSWSKGVTAQTYTYNTSTLPVGTSTFTLLSSWDKIAGQQKKETVSLKINSPNTLLTCNDPNASKYQETSETGDCGSCNDGFQKSDGLCQKVGCTTEGNYNYDETAEIHDESMCYDDSSDTPDAVDCELSDWDAWSDWSDWSDTDSGTRTRTRNRTIVTENANGGEECAATEETETETKDPETGEITSGITNNASNNDTAAQETPESGSFPVVPVLGGVLLLGVLLLRNR